MIYENNPIIATIKAILINIDSIRLMLKLSHEYLVAKYNKAGITDKCKPCIPNNGYPYIIVNTNAYNQKTIKNNSIKSFLQISIDPLKKV